jgi:hypothetical protein
VGDPKGRKLRTKLKKLILDGRKQAENGDKMQSKRQTPPLPRSRKTIADLTEGLAKLKAKFCRNYEVIVIDCQICELHVFR